MQIKVISWACTHSPVYLLRSAVNIFLNINTLVRVAHEDNDESLWIRAVRSDLKWWVIITELSNNVLACSQATALGLRQEYGKMDL